MHYLFALFLVLALGSAAFPIYQALSKGERPTWSTWMVLGLVAATTVVLFGNRATMIPTFGPPPKFDLSKETYVSKETLENCVASLNLQRPFAATVAPHSSGGFSVEIVGKDLMLSAEKVGLWERVGFFLDIEELGDVVRVQYVGLNGASTLSSRDVEPPRGERWEPFDGQEMARYNLQMDAVFTYLTYCLTDEISRDQRFPLVIDGD